MKEANRNQELRSLQRQLKRRRSEVAREQARVDSRAQSADHQSSASSQASDLDQLGVELGAQVGATIGPPGAAPFVAGSLQSGSAWSTIKVPIALEVVDEAGGAAGLSAAQTANIQAAITLSDNDAAAALFDDLVQSHGSVASASDAVTQLLRSAGDSTTSVSTEGRDGFSSYGQTVWTLSAQQQFMGALLNGCIGESDSRQLVLDQMRAVTADTWGLGSAGVPALWKGGWGPGADGRYLLRQMGEIEVDGRDYAVTLAVLPNNGDFATGQGIATEVAKWLVTQAPRHSGSAAGC